MKKRPITLSAILSLIIIVSTILTGCNIDKDPAGSPDTSDTFDITETTLQESEETTKPEEDTSDSGNDKPSVDITPVPDGFDYSSIPAFTDKPYVVLNNNVPFFKESEIANTCFEKYGDLDSLGRCTTAFACLGTELLPTGKREDISSVKPTGWVQKKYSCISTQDLYNRSHLIAWSLSGENANAKNLITGTPYMNQQNMTKFENQVLSYIKEEPQNHVMYRVTPVFEGNNLVASGVIMEAYSVEDNGEDIQFCVYLYNVQPGVIIDYATGESRAENPSSSSGIPEGATFIINKKKKNYHYLTSKYAEALTNNMEFTTMTEEELIAAGYKLCGSCKTNTCK